MRGVEACGNFLVVLVFPSNFTADRAPSPIPSYSTGHCNAVRVPATKSADCRAPDSVAKSSLSVAFSRFDPPTYSIPPNRRGFCTYRFLLVPSSTSLATDCMAKPSYLSMQQNPTAIDVINDSEGGTGDICRRPRTVALLPLSREMSRTCIIGWIPQMSDKLRTSTGGRSLCW